MRLVALLLGVLLLGGTSFPAVARADPETTELVAQAEAWLQTLSAAQRRQALQPFTSADRTDWHYVPRSRRGLALSGMDRTQRRAALSLVKAALGPQGFAKAEGVFALEAVLRQSLPPHTRARSPSWRDPGLYQIAVFGRPAMQGAWALRIEGHHLSVNLTMREGRIVAATPLFFGASPSAIRSGPRQGVRPLAAEEDEARAIVRALPADVRARVVARGRAPGDVLFGPFRAARPTGQGVPVGELPTASQQALKALVRTWIENGPPSFAARRLALLEGTSSAALRFVWLGSLDAGRPHAYRIEGPTMILEYVNRGDHVHTVWRSPTNDFGAASLAQASASMR